MKLILALLALTAGGFSQRADDRVVTLPAPDKTASEVDEVMAELQKITGLKPLRKVEYTRIERDKVRSFLEQRVKEVVKPEEIRAEETALKKFGFVPQDFDLEKTTIEMLTEQAAAFYDFRKRRLFLIGSDEGIMQHSVLVHELAHALADQHFDLDRYVESGKKSDDGSLARLAVMEGQATWLMSEYLTQRTGQSLKDSPVLIKMMSNPENFDSTQFPVFARAPLYLKESLMFPYTKGILFQHEIFLKKGRAAFAEVFLRPPAGTFHILHPEKYLAGAKPVKARLPAVEAERDYTEYTDGEVGEFDHAVLLTQYGGEELSQKLAPRWRGGAFRILSHKRDNRLVLAYASEWDTPETAREYFEAYRTVLDGKWKRFEITRQTPGSFSGLGDDGRFTVELEGTLVTSVEGLPQAVVNKRK